MQKTSSIQENNKLHNRSSSKLLTGTKRRNAAANITSHQELALNHRHIDTHTHTLL